MTDGPYEDVTEALRRALRRTGLAGAEAAVGFAAATRRAGIDVLEWFSPDTYPRPIEGCWADVDDRRYGVTIECGADPDPDDPLGLCIVHAELLREDPS